MIIDCHVHSEGNEEAEKIIDAMDKDGVDKAIFFAPYPGRIGERRISAIDPKPTKYLHFSYLEVTDDLQRKSTKFISELQAEAPERIIAFAWSTLSA